jgi:hypothetical protein
MSLRHPIAVLAFVALAACGPEFAGTEQDPSMLSPDAVGSAEGGVSSLACSTTQNLLLNPGFESGNVRWTASAGVIGNTAGQARSGSWRAMLAGKADGQTTLLTQTVDIPNTVCTATLKYFLKVTTLEPPGGWIVDTLQVRILDQFGGVMDSLAWYDNTNVGTTYVQQSFPLDVSYYTGQTITVVFEASEDSLYKTSFFVDDTSLTITK